MYFFDTYALCEISRGSQEYQHFVKDVRLKTALTNVCELYYILSRDGQAEVADRFFERLVPHCIEVLPEDVRFAAKFRLKNGKRSISYIDAIGYSVALRLGLQFLTGDSAFQELPQVTFIK